MARDALVDVIVRRVTFGVAPDVFRPFSLIHTDVVDVHSGREDKVLEILLLEPRCHAQIENQILEQTQY